VPGSSGSLQYTCSDKHTLRWPMLLQDGRLSMDELCVLVERMIKERERSM
jgi:hypothetical protein